MISYLWWGFFSSNAGHLVLTGVEPLDATLVEDKAEAPGEAPDPQTAGLSGARPLGLGVAVLPPLPPDVASNQFTPSNMAHKKRTSPLPTPPPPPPPRLDPEVNTLFYSGDLRGNGCNCIIVLFLASISGPHFTSAQGLWCFYLFLSISIDVWNTVC